MGSIARMAALACALLLAGKAWAADCPSFPPAVVHVSVAQVAPTYHNDRSRASVAQLAGNALNYHAQQGLTRTQTAFAMTTILNVAQLAPGRFCMALKEVNASWRLSRLDVDIVREQPPGSCPYRVVMEHENRHVAYAQSLFVSHAENIQARLVQLVGENRPLLLNMPLAQAKIVFRDRLMAGMQPVLAAFDQALARANAAIDTPENYRLETAKCPRWN